MCTRVGLAIALAFLVAASPARAATAAARVWLATPLVDGWLRAGLPAAARGVIAATDARYCGATKDGRGRLRVLLLESPDELRAGPPARRAPVALLPAGPAGCTASADEVARNAAAAAKAAAVADVLVPATPGARPALERTATAGKPGELAALPRTSGTPADAGASAGLPAFPALPSGRLVVSLPGGPTLPFFVSLAFHADGAEAVVALDEAAPAAAASRPNVPGGSNLAAEVPYDFANRVLTALTARKPIEVQLGPDVVLLRDLRVTGSPNVLVANATATPRSLNEPLALEVHALGDDLRLTNARAQVRTVDCAALPFVERVRCAAANGTKQAGAAALGPGIEQAAHGRTLRELAGPQDWPIDVPGAPSVVLHVDVLRISAQARTFTLGGAARVIPSPR